jgi:formiminotetrahydrofolate cyclodeaminase
MPKTPERELAMEAAMREAIRVPMDSARSAVRGLNICREASSIGVAGLTAADLGAAAALLSGAIDAMLLSVESNLREIPGDNPLRDEIRAELSGFRSLTQMS